MSKQYKIVAYGTQDFMTFIDNVRPYVGKGKPIQLVATSEIEELKTNPQLRYLHDIIEDYLVDVLFEQGCIEAKSPHLAKFWLKEYIGYGEEVRVKIRGHKFIRFNPKSFADASKKVMSEAIEAVIRVCAFAGVNVPDPIKLEANGE